VVRGPKSSVYEGGIYFGKLLFPSEYPYKPPSIIMLTPNGRFKTDTKLCLSMSDFHPETWNPLWSVGSILQGLLSFMLETAPTYGSMESDDTTKRRYAADSLSWNVTKLPVFNTLFPHYKRASSSSSSSSTNGSGLSRGRSRGSDGDGDDDDDKSSSAVPVHGAPQLQQQQKRKVVPKQRPRSELYFDIFAVSVVGGLLILLVSLLYT